MDFADDGADGVQVRGDGAVGAVAPSLERGANGAAARQLEGDAEFVQALGHIAHYGVGETGGAGNGEHFQQNALQVIEVGFGNLLAHFRSCSDWCVAPLRLAFWLKGKSRSMKRSAVGWG